MLFVHELVCWLNQTPQPQRGWGYKNPLAARAGEGFSLSAHNRNVLLGLNFPTLLPPPRSGQRERREGKKKRGIKERKTKNEKKQQCSDAER